MEVTIENLERAVSQFYHTDSEMQAQAHQWLTAAQSSPNAWAFVWELLRPERSAEVQFFAATTLHTKIMRSWSEVPPEQYGQLKEKLLQSVIHYALGPKIVLNRLCISLSAFVIQTMPFYWRDSLVDLMAMLTPANFPNIPPERVIWILLEIFSVIPEEFDSMILPQKHKTMIQNDLESAASGVVGMVESLLACGEGGAEVEAQAVKTAVSWIHLGTSLPSCIPLAKRLVDLILAGRASEGCEHELEALYQMVSHPLAHQYPQSVLEILEIIMPLSRMTEDPSNSEMIFNIYKVFVGIAESHTSLFLKSLCREEYRGRVESLIRIILRCTHGPGSYPTEETHSQLTFALWYIIQDEMVNLTEAEAAAAKTVVIPAYEEVAGVLLAKSQYPPDNRSLSAQDAEAFRCYRQDIADTMMYCYYVIRSNLVALLVRALANASTWQEVEAVYHVAFSLAETVAPGDDAAIVAMLTSPPSLADHPKVVNTLNQSIGAYSEWLSGQTEAVSALVPRLVAALGSMETATSATMALKDVARECTHSLRPLAGPLYASCQEALSRGHLKQNERCRLMYCMGRLLSLMPYETLVAQLRALLEDLAGSLYKLLQIAQQGTWSEAERRAASSQLGGQLRLTGQLLMTLYSEESCVDPPALLALGAVLPLFGPLVNAYRHDSSVLQEMCVCLKNSVCTLLDRAEPLLKDVIAVAVPCYTAQPNPVTLELVKHIVLLFGGSKEDSSGVMAVGPLLNAVMSATIGLGDQAREHSDAVQAFHSLVANVVKKKPHLAASVLNCDQLIEFATRTLGMAEKGCVQAASNLLSAIVANGRDYPAFLNAIRRNGLSLTAACLAAIGGDWAWGSLDSICDVLFNLNKKFSDDLGRWLSEALSTDGFPTPRATPSAKSSFSRAIVKERANKRKLQEAAREFSVVCRGLATTDLNYPPI